MTFYFMARYQTRGPNTEVPYPSDMVPGKVEPPGVSPRCVVFVEVPTRAVTGRAASRAASAFIKLVYGLIGCAALISFFIRLRQGGSLAAAAATASAGLVFAIGAVVVVFGVLVVGSSFRR